MVLPGWVLRVTAACSTCETAAGPTIRVSVDAIMAHAARDVGGQSYAALSLTAQQALDLYKQLGREFSRNRIPHIDIPE